MEDNRKEASPFWKLMYKKIHEIESQIDTECNDCRFDIACDLYAELYEELKILNLIYKLDEE